jgi:hypothetical protein
LLLGKKDGGTPKNSRHQDKQTNLFSHWYALL